LSINLAWHVLTVGREFHFTLSDRQTAQEKTLELLEEGWDESEILVIYGEICEVRVTKHIVVDAVRII